ncbi:hypothetical protein BUE80_DR000259 [Diplocarpon rosae]|nr:hypothetical protein BUE80_DR000259 [Diplocarpon rosae]
MRPILFAIALLYSVGVGAIPSDITPVTCDPHHVDCANPDACKALTLNGGFPCPAGSSQNDAPCTTGNRYAKPEKRASSPLDHHDNGGQAPLVQ